MTALWQPDVSIASALRGFQGIELADLDALAALQTRHDRKYLLAPERLPDMLGSIDGPLQVLDIDGQREFSYRSTYFDTPECRSYQDAARSRPKRFKIRTRTYLATGSCWLEVKARSSRGLTTKVRIEHPPESESELTPIARNFIDLHEQVCVDVDTLAPTLVTGYERATIHCVQRATIDTGLWCARTDGTDVHLGALGDLLIIETKSLGKSPGPIDRALWHMGVRPSTISKYAVGMAAAHSSLPANKWTRVLRRHVGFSGGWESP